MVHTKTYIHPFLPTTFGPIYYAPPQYLDDDYEYYRAALYRKDEVKKGGTPLL